MIERRSADVDQDDLSDDLGQRGQILWIRGITRLQHQVSLSLVTTTCSSSMVGQKSKPAYICNNFVYCQPIFIIYHNIIHCRKFATGGFIVSLFLQYFSVVFVKFFCSPVQYFYSASAQNLLRSQNNVSQNLPVSTSIPYSCRGISVSSCMTLLSPQDFFL